MGKEYSPAMLRNCGYFCFIAAFSVYFLWLLSYLLFPSSLTSSSTFSLSSSPVTAFSSNASASLASWRRRHSLGYKDLPQQPYEPPPKPLDRCLLFWHLQKTGGTTLNHILEGTTKLWNKTFSQELKGGLRVKADFLSGHVEIDKLLPMLEFNRTAEKKFKKELCYWLFSQRDPLDRFMSRFYYKQLRVANVKWGNDIEAFVRKGHRGMRTLRTLHTERQFQRLLAVLDTFEMVVVAERFDESLILLEADGVISPEVVRNYSNYGVVQGRPKVESLASDVKEKLREFLELDIRLYEAAMAKLDQRVERFGRERMQQRLQALAQTRKEVPCAEERGGLKGSGACKNFTEVDKFLSGRVREKYVNY
ncbi:Galactosylceramide sulfotransferase [Balamuthia mandrillaris]